VQSREKACSRHEKQLSEMTIRSSDAPVAGIERQRLDKWLWHARVVRTRSAAAALVASGHVRVNAVKVETVSRAVRAGDVVTVALDRAVRVLKVTGFAERRGSADAARALFLELAANASE
jgi:ribosome-associated heat shock protein Hsp15